MAKSNIRNIRKKTPISAYEEIRWRIVNLEYAPGMSLDEKSLVDELGLSRTPVREALIRLSGEGLIEIEKNKGAKVTDLDIKSLQSIFEAGDLIERAYTRLACLRRTEHDLLKIEQAMRDFERYSCEANVPGMVDANTAFHLHIAAASGNKYFEDSYSRILADHERIAQIWYSENLKQKDSSPNQLLNQQHHDLYHAIKAGNIELAESASVAHATTCKEGIRSLLNSGEALLADLQVNPNPV